MKLDDLPRDYSIFVRPIGKDEWCATVYHQKLEWSSASGGTTPTKAVQTALNKLEVTIANISTKTTSPAAEFPESPRLAPKKARPVEPDPCSCGKSRVYGSKGLLHDRCMSCSERHRRDEENRRRREKKAAQGLTASSTVGALPCKPVKVSHKAKIKNAA